MAQTLNQRMLDYEPPKHAYPVKSKKVYSKPLQAEETNSLIVSAATEYVPYANEISEEARKQLRVNRLRQATCNYELNAKVLTDAKAGDWAKQ